MGRILTETETDDRLAALTGGIPIIVVPADDDELAVCELEADHSAGAQLSNWLTRTEAIAWLEGYRAARGLFDPPSSRASDIPV